MIWELAMWLLFSIFANKLSQSKLNFNTVFILLLYFCSSFQESIKFITINALTKDFSLSNKFDSITFHQPTLVTCPALPFHSDT